MEKLFTQVKVRPYKQAKGATRANGSALVAGTVEVNFSIMEGKNGLFVKFPSYQATVKNKETGAEEKRWYQHVRIPDETARKSFSDMVLSAYSASLKGGSQPQAAQASAGETSQAAAEDDIPF